MNQTKIPDGAVRGAGDDSHDGTDPGGASQNRHGDHGDDRSHDGGGAQSDYRVGYKRPPLATRFRPGGVGNPKGRPRKRKSVGRIIDDIMMTRVNITDNGHSKTKTLQEIILLNLGKAAARGEIKAIYAMYAIWDRYRDGPEATLNPSDLEPEDRKIIEGYLARFRNGGFDHPESET